MRTEDGVNVGTVMSDKVHGKRDHTEGMLVIHLQPVGAQSGHHICERVQHKAQICAHMGNLHQESHHHCFPSNVCVQAASFSPQASDPKSDWIIWLACGMRTDQMTDLPLAAKQKLKSYLISSPRKRESVRRTANPPMLAPNAPTRDHANESRVVARGSSCLETMVGVMARRAGS